MLSLMIVIVMVPFIEFTTTSSSIISGLEFTHIPLVTTIMLFFSRFSANRLTLNEGYKRREVIFQGLILGYTTENAVLLGITRHT